MIHFLPSSSHRGGLTTAALGAAAAPGLKGLNGLGLALGEALNGWGPCILRLGFLCVFWSSPTFFSPATNSRIEEN